MTYDEALDYIWGTPGSGTEDRLTNLGELLAKLDNPHLGMNYVHVAGTNGKGSVCAYTSHILREAGYKTGLYISPHLERINERIQINGEQISNDELAEITTEVSAYIGAMKARPTIFAIITAIAYVYFKRKGCDIVVLETGVGGRLDATNAIEASVVSVITNIGYDHTDYLGSTLTAIAGEKAGIIKKNGTVVLYKQTFEVMNVMENVCAEKNARLIIADGDEALIKSLTVAGTQFEYGGSEEFKIPLPGLYQVKNAVTAICAAKVLQEKGWRVDTSIIKRGLTKTQWPGRFELMHEKPAVIVDGTHNPQGAEALLESLKALFPDKLITFVVGALEKKDYSGNVKLAAPLAKRFYAVAPDSDHALAPEALAEEIGKHGKPVGLFGTIAETLDAVMLDSNEDDVICVFGTLYQVSEVKAYFTPENQA